MPAYILVFVSINSMVKGKLFCMKIASKCLLWRIHQRNTSETLLSVWYIITLQWLCNNHATLIWQYIIQSLYIPKELSEAVNRWRTDNTLNKRKRTKGQTVIYKALNKNLDWVTRPDKSRKLPSDASKR